MSFKKIIETHPALIYIAKWLLICSIIGVCIGSASALFLISLNWATDYREAHQWLIVFLPIAGLCVGLLYNYFGKSVEAGNNLLIDTIHHPEQKIPARMAPMIYLGTIVTHLFGGSAGREGTALQMAGSIADQWTSIFRLNNDDRRTLLIAAIAAGFGSVFGTPLAGAVFALEVVSIGRLRYTALFPAMTAAILACFVADLWPIVHTHYHIHEIPPITIVTIAHSVAAGIIFGIIAAIFSKTSFTVSSFIKNKISYAPLRPFLGGCLIAITIFIIGTSKYIGLGIPTIVESFEQPLPAYDFAAKLLFTIVTLSAGFKGGEVTPLFFIGACLGNALAYILALPLSLLAGMGFVAVFAGATNTPLACTIMAIELFGSECGIYVAIACVVSYLVSGNTGIYRKQMIGEAKYRQFEHLEGKRLADL